MELTSKQAAYLRGLAHALDPVVQTGKAGVTAALIKEVERNLKDHELIKVRIGCEERAEFLQTAEQLASTTRAELVQTIGRIALLYREGEEPEIKLPKRR